MGISLKSRAVSATVNQALNRRCCYFKNHFLIRREGEQPRVSQETCQFHKNKVFGRKTVVYENYTTYYFSFCPVT